MEESYANIRELMGGIIGKRLVDITQHDADEFAESGDCYVMFMFEDGSYIRFPVDDAGFEFSEEGDGE